MLFAALLLYDRDQLSKSWFHIVYKTGKVIVGTLGINSA